MDGKDNGVCAFGDTVTRFAGRMHEHRGQGSKREIVAYYDVVGETINRPGVNVGWTWVLR